MGTLPANLSKGRSGGGLNLVSSTLSAEGDRVRRGA